MKKINNSVFAFYCFWTVLVAVLNVFGKITFGHGFGDVYYLAMLLIAFALILLIWILAKKRRLNNKAVTALTGIILVVIIAFTLKLTIFRGPEYVWNGTIFLTK